MIIYIYGSDTFRSREYLKDQVTKFKATRDPQGYNTVFLDAAKEEPGRIFSEIVAAPFLAEKRMVVLENILLNKDKNFLGEMIERIRGCHAELDSASKFKPEKILKQVQDDSGKKRDDKKTNKLGIPASNVIVFWQGDEMGKVKEVKELDELLAKEKYAYKFGPLTEAELRGWILGEVKKRGGKINNFAVNYLAQNVGGDMWQLHSLIDQLLAYKNGGEIEQADTQLFLEEKIDDNIFSLVDAIVNGNKKIAFKLLAEQRRLGADEPQIFGAIVWQFRTLISIRDLINREDNLTSDEIARRLGMKPFPVRKSLPMAKRFSLDKLRELYQQLLDIDIKTKTGAGEQGLLLDVFVGRMGG